MLRCRSHWLISTLLGRGIYDVPKPHRPTKPAKLEVAKNALLQLNVMIDQGIEPDIFMYTSLLTLMGEAGLEWQAYKLFSRLLEKGLKPLPETYIALQRATHPSRKTVIADLERKAHDAAASLPDEVAAAEKQRQEREDAEAQRSFEALLGEDKIKSTHFPVAPTAFDAADEKTADASSSSSPAHARRFGDSGSIPTMTEVTPRGALRIEDSIHLHRHMESIRSENAGKEQELREALALLHDEELRILLTIHRQFRSGERKELIERVIANIRYSEIQDVIRRRKRYFSTLTKALELQMRDLQESDGMDSDELRRKLASENTERDSSDTKITEAASSPPAVACEASPRAVAHRPLVDELEGTSALEPATDGTVTPRDEYEGSSVDALAAPWGVIRKPPASAGFHRLLSATPPSTNPLREHRTQLSDNEQLQIYIASRTGELHNIPEALLLRYARQHRVSWRRGTTNDLHTAVAWHVETFPPTRALSEYGVSIKEPGEVVEARHEARIREVERRGMSKTMENFDALRIIAKRCGNMQIVDSVSISRAIDRLRRKAKMIRKAHVEAEVRGAAIAVQQSTEEMLQSFPAFKLQELQEQMDQGRIASSSSPKRIVGLEAPVEPPATDDHAVSSEDAPGIPDPEDSANTSSRELPPWAVKFGTQPFDFRRGCFGDPRVAQLKEQSDGTIGVSFEAQRAQGFHVAVDGLPDADRKTVKNNLLALELAAHTPAATAWRKRNVDKELSPQYNKYLQFIERAKARKAAKAVDNERVEAKPLVERRRMAYRLMKGRDKVKAKHKPATTPPS